MGRLRGLVPRRCTSLAKAEAASLFKTVGLKADLAYLEAYHTESGKRRSMPLNGEARQAILSRARFRATHCPASKWLFTHENGNRIGNTKWSFATACRKAGIEDFRIHDLRRMASIPGSPVAGSEEPFGSQLDQDNRALRPLAPENVRAAVTFLKGNESR